MNNTEKLIVLFFLLVIAWVYWVFPSTRVYILTLAGIIIGLFILVLICANLDNIYFCCNRCFGEDCCSGGRSSDSDQHAIVEEGKTLCYLCHTQVPKGIWDSGEHRRACAIERAGKLNRMTPYRHKICPKCDQFLRIWPGEGEEFYCNNNRLCRRSDGRAIGNWGSPIPRYTCFLCDVTFCIDCLQAEIGGTVTTPSNPVGETILSNEDTEPDPWIPSAPPDEDKLSDSLLQPGNGHMEPPSYDEAVLSTSPQETPSMPTTLQESNAPPTASQETNNIALQETPDTNQQDITSSASQENP